MECKNNKPKDDIKYGMMGVTPKELYFRQTGKCWLELVYDDYGENTKEVGDLYCTDGKEYAITGNMLNPSYECVKCLTFFILNGARNGFDDR